MTTVPRARKDRLGEALRWLTGGVLALNLVLILGLITLLAAKGLGYFWQDRLVRIVLDDGVVLLGEIHDREPVAAAMRGSGSEPAMRIRLKLGNRDLTGSDFRWVDESRIVERSAPEDAVLIERLEWGNFYGFLRELRGPGGLIAEGPEGVRAALAGLQRDKRAELTRIRRLERREIGDINHRLEQLRLSRRALELRSWAPGELERRSAEIQRRVEEAQGRYRSLVSQLEALRRDFERETLVAETADGTRKEIPVGHVVRLVPANTLDGMERSWLYLSRLWELVADEPREANTEGGIFPAIFGTVMMVLLMSIAVVPFGVLAAVYLHEYAREGLVLRLVRIAVNNLAGVPSIVFGVFGLGFFVYLVGGTIDRLFYPEALPTPTYGTGGILWASLTLAFLTVPVVIVATEEGLAAVPRAVREGSLALGATKFETVRRIVVPAAAPGILTGLILAMARAAGEVAPLMIVGMVKLAPSLPVDHHFPFVHLERKFMHLGFHIYDLGFQSPNVEAVKPLVFATALLLVLVVLITNVSAILLRNHLREKYATQAV